MNQISLQDFCKTTALVGLGVAVVPLAATCLAACSKIILINIIADLAVRIITLNNVSLFLYGISFVELPPILWQISFLSAALGGTITAVALGILLAHKLYHTLPGLLNRS
jgi:hypothetical protein